MTSTPTKDIRSFAILAGGFLTLLGLWPFLFSGDVPRYWLLAVAVCIVSLGLINPPMLGPVYRIWIKLGSILGFINTRIILSLGFFVIFTPLGVMMRLLGRDPLNRGYNPSLPSYRMPHAPRPEAHMEKQF